jgi:hypothetical protein
LNLGTEQQMKLENLGCYSALWTCNSLTHCKSDSNLEKRRWLDWLLSERRQFFLFSNVAFDHTHPLCKNIQNKHLKKLIFFQTVSWFSKKANQV